MNVTEELIGFRRRLAGYSRDRPSYEAVRQDLDALICLQEEAPLGRHNVIERLVDKYEALLRSLSN